MIRSKLLKGLKTCKCCGKKFLMQGYDADGRLTEMMDKKCICFDCAFWQDLINYPPRNLEILGHKALQVFPPSDKKDKSLHLGGGGKMRYFMRDDWSVLCSNDIWSIGTVPDRFLKDLKPTMTEITERAYKRLKAHKNKCSARACFNRYMCLRYDLSIENDSIGAYNKPPKNWNPKNETCRHFINFSEIRIDESSDTNNEQA